MKTAIKIILGVLIISESYSCIGQQYAFANANFDPNKAFHFMDNPRTETDHTGLDFNLETGIEAGNVKVFIYYGRFQTMGYQEYGMGADYIFHLYDNLDLTTGLAYGSILRMAEYYEEPTWMNMLAWNARTKLIYWLGNFGINGSLQFQQRPDIESYGIIEGSMGIMFRVEINS